MCDFKLQPKWSGCGGCLERAVKSIVCVCVCVHLCSSFPIPDSESNREIEKRSNRGEARRREEDTGERENQLALTLRQSISSLLSLFPMGRPG